jgi:hypothetical protein
VLNVGVIRQDQLELNAICKPGNVLAKVISADFVVHLALTAIITILLANHVIAIPAEPKMASVTRTQANACANTDLQDGDAINVTRISTAIRTVEVTFIECLELLSIVYRMRLQ